MLEKSTNREVRDMKKIFLLTMVFALLAVSSLAMAKSDQPCHDPTEAVVINLEWDDMLAGNYVDTIISTEVTRAIGLNSLIFLQNNELVVAVAVKKGGLERDGVGLVLAGKSFIIPKSGGVLTAKKGYARLNRTVKTASVLIAEVKRIAYFSGSSIYRIVLTKDLAAKKGNTI